MAMWSYEPTSVVSGNLLASWIQCRKEQANVSLTRLNRLPNSHGLLEKSDFWASVTTQAVSGELQHASLELSRPLSLGRDVRSLPRPLSPWGFLSDASIRFWWNRQVIINQYGRAGRAAAKWGEDTIEEDLPLEILAANRRYYDEDNVNNPFRDEEYYSSKEFNLEDIKVPVLSVANWGGILLHLRGNMEGYTWAGSQFKYLRFITGRHDLPFYFHDEVEVQRLFLDVFLKGKDTVWWSIPGKVSPVSMVLQKGYEGFNNPKAEALYEYREESAWPIPRTQYIKYHLVAGGSLSTSAPSQSQEMTVFYQALEKPELVQFSTAPMDQDTEITGNVIARLNVSIALEDPHL
jgi:hypothetical protein